MFQDFIPKWTFVFLFLGSHLLLKVDCIEDLGSVAPGSPSEDCNVINSLNIDQKEQPSLGVFPNPAKDRPCITIDQQYTPRNGFLLDLLGHPLIQFIIMERQELDISPLPPGTYLIKVGKSSALVSKI